MVLLKVPKNQLDRQRVGEVTPESIRVGMGVQQGGVSAKVSWTMHQYKMGIPGVIPTLQGCGLVTS